MTNYEKRLESAKRRYAEDKRISEVNREYIKDYLKTYNVKPSTEAKFYDFIRYFLAKTKDAKLDMKDRDKMSSIFDKLHSELKPNGYSTVASVTKTFLKWLNDGDFPKSMNYIKKLTKEEKRKLQRAKNPDYELVTWEEGLKMAKNTNSVQLKGMIMVQLDVGMRPSEFFDLNYGDIKRDGRFFIARVRKTKTGEPRSVLIYRSAPFLNRWLEAHPTQSKNDPLWLLESQLKSSIEKGNMGRARYTIDGAKKTLQRIASKSGIKKSVSLYYLRHAAISLAKQERLNVDVAAKRFGHSIKFYCDTYGALTEEQETERQKAHYGESTKEKEKKPKSHVCSICNTINEPDRSFCEKCNNPLTLKTALEVEGKKDKEISDLQQQMSKVISKLGTVDELTKAIKMKKEGK